MMGAVSSLVTGAYGTMCKCFSIGLLLSRSLFCRAILEIFVILENFCYCLIQKTLGELPDFEVMTWQLCNLLRSTLNCLQGTLILL